MDNSSKKICIGTRGSPLALKQVEMVRAALAEVAPKIETEVVVIKTSGDWRSEDGEVRLNADAGGKGQFAKEIEEALLAGSIDCAVHSMKDMETVLPEGLIIPCMLPREDVRDVLLVSDNLRSDIAMIDDLPQGATVGTASVRRQAFLLNRRPDLKIVPFRGNVQTRIEKVRAGQVDATLLAIAGLKRLDLQHEIDVILEPNDFLPAAAQGAVGIELREIDQDLIAVFSQLNCADTMLCVMGERAVLRILDGSCHTPIGALAQLENGHMILRAKIATLDGAQIYGQKISGHVQHIDEANVLGETLGKNLKLEIPAGILSQRIEE